MDKDGDSSVDITECYGVKCLTCTLPDCEFKEVGINVIREKKAEMQRVHGTARTVSYDDKLTGDELLQGIADDAAENEYGDPDIAKERRQAALDATNKIIHFYLEKPAQFDAFVKEFYFGQNQSAIARSAGVTRQAISKAIQTENLANCKRQIDNLTEWRNTLSGLSPLELRVYQLSIREGLSIREVAGKLKISRAKAHRVRQILSLKLPKNETFEKSIPEKILQKITKRVDQTPDLFTL